MRARSIVCGSSFSSTRNEAASRPPTNRSVLSITVASSSTRETPVVSMISNGARSIASEPVLPRRIARVDANAGRLERVVVDPLDGVRRTVPVVADQRVVHVEPDRSERDLRRMGDLRDDADGARQPEAAERRRDAHRQQRVAQARRQRGRLPDPATCVSPQRAAPLRPGRRRERARASRRRRSARRSPLLTRTPAQAPRLPRSSWRTRPRAARGSAAAARRGTRPATAPARSGRGGDSRAARSARGRK